MWLTECVYSLCITLFIKTSRCEIQYAGRNISKFNALYPLITMTTIATVFAGEKVRMTKLSVNMKLCLM